MPTAEPNVKRKRVGLWISALCIAVALSCFGWVAWSAWGTSLVSNQEQQQAQEEMLSEWGLVPLENGDVPDPKISGDLSVVEKPITQSSAVPVDPQIADATITTSDGSWRGIALLTVPSAGLHSVPVFEGSEDDVLNQGVAGHYEGMARPGELGNFAVAGHRVSHSAIFNNLDQVNIGDLIKVRTKNHSYTYKVNVIKTVDPEDASPLSPVPFKPGTTPTEAYITLTTCTPKFTTLKRLIISGILVSYS